MPVRYPVPDNVREIVREQLGPQEPVLVSLSNEGDTIQIIATPQRLMTVRSGGNQAGVTGCTVKDFPWAGITKMILQHAAMNLKIAIHYRTMDGRTVEVGRRAKMGKDAVENLTPFEQAAGGEAFDAMKTLWEHLKSAE